MSTAIQDMLGELCGVSGVRGAAVLTEEGIMVASVLRQRFSEDVVAGLASFLIMTTRKSLGDSRRFRRFTMHSTNGKLILDEVDGAFLVTIVDQFAELEAILAEIDDTSRRLRRIQKIHV